MTMTKLSRLLCLGAATAALMAPTVVVAGAPYRDDGGYAASKPGADDRDQGRNYGPPDDNTPPYDDDQDRGGGNVTITNGPVPDTPENRDRYGGPDSGGGTYTRPAGN